MKALTLWQPWASLMVLGFKKVETRIWATKYRGTIAIHSAKKTPTFIGLSRHASEFVRHLEDCGIGTTSYAYYREGKMLPEGVVLGTAELVAVEETDSVVEDLTSRERVFGNYESGRYAWFFEHVKVFNHPIPAKGNRMLWNWDEGRMA